MSERFPILVDVYGWKNVADTTRVLDVLKEVSGVTTSFHNMTTDPGAHTAFETMRELGYSTCPESPRVVIRKVTGTHKSAQTWDVKSLLVNPSKIRLTFCIADARR